MKRISSKNNIESFLVMILMVVFAVSISFIIIQGKLAFERVTENKIEDENARIALSYINKRVRQNDQQDGFKLLENSVEGATALRISHDEEGLFTYIFHHEGVLYECYTDTEATIKFSSPIIEISQLTMQLDGNLLLIEIPYEYHGNMITLEQIIHLRSEGASYD
jgi:hypothetical protein